MMNWIFAGMIFLALVFGALNGRMDAVNASAIGESYKAIKLVIELSGAICLWSGLTNIAEKSGLTKTISHFFSPMTKRLFKNLDENSPAMAAISMNFTANFLGLGNAATPLGISAMKHLGDYSKDKQTATNNMVIFVVMNTASLQLIPTTTAMLRLNAGSENPMMILPCVWVSSLVSVLSGLAMAFILQKLQRKNSIV